MDEYELRLREYATNCFQMIEKHGWMIQGIGASPFWAYTIGLTAKTRQELVVVGMTISESHVILNAAATKQVSDPFAPGVLIDIGMFVRFQTQEISSRELRLARALYGDTFPDTALQLLWPDGFGRYPLDRQIIPD